MIDRTANLLGVVGLAVAGRIEQTARDILNHAGETPAALVVIGYGLGPSNDELRQVLGLSHPGVVRLVDRLVADRLGERLHEPHEPFLLLRRERRVERTAPGSGREAGGRMGGTGHRATGRLAEGRGRTPSVW